jgi:UDP-GlcNAc:undecaprenyl-phosphate/decaprenyl-phosphate GlcNAc-1-phosphate transferase
MVSIFFPFFISFLVSSIGLSFLRYIAFRYNITDKPDNNLKQHGEPVAYLGGVGIYIGLFVSSLLFFINMPHIFGILLGLLCFLLLGLFDDIWPIKPYQKFAGQLFIAIYFVSIGLHLNESFISPWLNIGISIFWILSVVNSFNLIDIMDGLATTVAIGSILIIMVSAILLNSLEIACFCLAMVGALIPFFIINYPPACMYLGDAGSLMIGGFLATTPFTLQWTRYTRFGNLIPPAILGIILLECLSLIIIRLYKGIPPYKGSRDHFAHYLLDNGWSKKNIIWYIFGLNCYIGLIVSLFLIGIISFSLTLILGLLFLIIWLVGLIIPKQKAFKN